MPTPSPAEDLLNSGEMRARAELLLAAILRFLIPVLVVAALFTGQTTQREIVMPCILLAFTLGLHVPLLRQVWLNRVGNAIKYSRRRDPPLTLPAR